MRSLGFALFLSLFALSAEANLPAWTYDPGPSPNEKLGRELIDLHAEIPYMPGLSEVVTGGQKFRPAFGPVLWRMRQEKNTVKILFIGQDATHIAEAAGRTATAGFGGRAQDLAKYFGVNESAAFINTFAYTIRGQYGAFQTPYLRNKNGKTEVQFSGFVDNPLWLLSMDQASPLTEWRNGLIDWIIRNNQDSLQMIVLFGGAARDAAATFVESKGGKVGTRFSVESLKNIQVPQTKLEYAGGNNEFPVPLTTKGEDLYEALLGRKIDYEKPENLELATKTLEQNIDRWASEMALPKGGPLGNGMIHPAQLGGYDLRQMEINGKQTYFLKGLPLADGSRIKNNVLLVSLPHPSALSRMQKDEASKAVAQALENIKPAIKQVNWKISADPGQTNSFAAGQDYVYSRAEIGPEYYDFGTPATRMVSVSDASRLSGNPHVIIFGTRDRVELDKRALEEMTQAKPSTLPSAKEVYVSRARLSANRYVFDAGPGEKFAKLMKENLDLEKIFAPKAGKDWKANGIDAFHVKSHPDLADFGHYRGTFQNPRVLIVADPAGYDDLITARALTGSRGQYLHGLMEDLGVHDQYLVLKTVPFGMDGATKEEWQKVLSLTEKYREEVLREVVNQQPELILADGPYAAAELKRIFGANSPVIEIKRQLNRHDFGIAEAAATISTNPKFKGTKASLRMVDIPRSHLSYYARLWEGTSGDRVLNASDKNKGKAFAEVAPKWAWGQKVDLTPTEVKGAKELLKKLEDNNLPKPGEPIEKFLLRRFTWLPVAVQFAA